MIKSVKSSFTESLKVVASTTYTKYGVLAVNPVGSAPVVVKNICVPVFSLWFDRVTTHGDAILIVGFHIATCPVSVDAPDAEAKSAYLSVTVQESYRYVPCIIPHQGSILNGVYCSSKAVI